MKLCLILCRFHISYRCSAWDEKKKKKEIIRVINAGVRLTCMNIANNLRTNAGMTMSLTIFTE